MVFDSLKRFLDQRWRVIVWFGLLFGLAHALIQWLTAYKAFQNSQIPGTGWEVKVLYNTIGEGPFEFYVLIPFTVAVISLAVYVFYEKWQASLS
jgi:hypothetical protein